MGAATILRKGWGLLDDAIDTWRRGDPPPRVVDELVTAAPKINWRTDLFDRDLYVAQNPNPVKFQFEEIRDALYKRSQQHPDGFKTSDLTEQQLEILSTGQDWQRGVNKAEVDHNVAVLRKIMGSDLADDWVRRNNGGRGLSPDRLRRRIDEELGWNEAEYQATHGFVKPGEPGRAAYVKRRDADREKFLDSVASGRYFDPDTAPNVQGMSVAEIQKSFAASRTCRHGEKTT